ncbi:efflux RND transporter permease subunit [Akkermansia glycaniphila]|uniref:efflux RND transporter permease subunit n=1 Tax=Akkermansia glycaniphila TaxID=1679444 RepID=UPI001C013AC8|nr:efflux RND transporter permease subunit [Akkermansia glycaniphila]MBT9449522.1 efflux RND transporter permease subunit [Akkermansia glycaniphila]
MNFLISFCLNNRITVILLTIALAIIGIFVIKNTPVDVFPELKVPRVTIQTESSGLTAEEVEQYITIPISSAMNGTAGVKAVRNSSGNGLSFVWVDFDWDTDIYRARQIVTERLAAVRDSLPEGVSPELTPIVSVTGEIMLIALTGDKDTSPLDMRQLAEYKLRNRLLGIPGVGQITVLGGRLPEYQILYDPNRLKQNKVDLNELKTAITESQSTIPAGYLEDVAGQELPIQQDSRMMNLEQIRRAILPGHPSGTIRVEDVADVSIDGAPRRGDAGFMQEDAVILSIQKVPGANTLALTQAVDDAVKEFSQSQLPKGMKLHTNAYRQSDFIELSLENGMETLLIAGAVVMIVLFLTLLNVRTALITLISMPLSVLFGMAMFPLFGLAINIMTLGGLAVAVGDVVDNAIIFVEIAWRHLNRNAALPPEQRKSKYEVLMKAKGEIIGSISFSSVIILLVFTPVLFLSGLEGQFFRPLGISYMLALLASLIVAVTITPVLCYIWFKKSKNEATRESGDSFSARLIKRVYTPLLDLCMKFSKTVCAVMAAITLLALWLGSSFGTSFLPPFNEDCYTVFVSTVPGTSLDETTRISRQAMKDIQQIPGVLSVAQRTGRAENDAHAEPVSASELLVRVDLKQDQKKLREEIKKRIDNIPGTSSMIGYPLAHRISSALSGSNSEIAINIYGTDLPQLRLAAQKAREILSSMPEVADARANREIMVDTVRIQYNPEALAAYGLTMANAAEQVSTAMNGQKLGEVIKNQDHWNIVLRQEPNLRASMDDVKNLELISPDKRSVKLDDVAHVYKEEISNLILRDNTMRKAMISCNPAPDSNLGDLAQACREKLDPVMNAMGCTVDYDGTIKARESASQRLYILGSIVMVLIVLLLSSALGSVRRAMLTLVNIPLCLVGGIVAVFLASPETLSSLFGDSYIPPILSVASIVGFVTVIGFAIRSGLILLNRYRDLEHQGRSLEDAIREGSQERVVPIIMTSLTTVLGLLPLIWAIDKPGGELLGPLAIVQFGGLVSATILNLLIIPATAKLFGRWISARRKELIKKDV